MDTGSDISAIRSELYDEYFKHIPLTKSKISIRGIGSSKVETLGSFQRQPISDLFKMA